MFSRQRASAPVCGFSLIELMIAVAIVGILATIGITNYKSMVNKSADSVTKGNLGTIRSALSVYYSDNDGIYPTDNLASITGTPRYLSALPMARALPYHPETYTVTAEAAVSETGGWSYNNDRTSLAWGQIHFGCLHTDVKGNTWSSF